MPVSLLASGGLSVLVGFGCEATGFGLHHEVFARLPVIHRILDPDRTSQNWASLEIIVALKNPHAG